MYTNPADHILDVITDVSGADHDRIQQNVKNLLQQKESDDKSGEEEEDEDEDNSEVEDSYKGKLLSKDMNQQRAAWGTQVKILFQRALIDAIRNKSVLYAQLINILLMSFLMGTVFLDVGTHQGSISKRNAALFSCVINQVFYLFISILFYFVYLFNVFYLY